MVARVGHESVLGGQPAFREFLANSNGTSFDVCTSGTMVLPNHCFHYFGFLSFLSATFFCFIDFGFYPVFASDICSSFIEN